MNLDQAQTLLKENDVKFVLAQFVDVHGVAKTKAVPVSHFEDILTDGAGFAGFAVWGLGQEPHDPDFMAVGDLDTLSLVPWQPGFARIVCTGRVNGEPYPFDTRYILQQQVKRLDQKGWTLNTGLEPEFMLLSRNPDGSIRPADDTDTLEKPCYDYKGLSRSRAFLEMLVAERVEVIFGNPGTSESSIMALLPQYPSLRYMLATQEGVAMGMADGYAQASGNPAVVNLHIEAGLANGISLLHHAMDGGTPLVLTAGNKDVRKLVEGRTDLPAMVGQFVKWSAEVTHPEQMPGVMRRAFQEAKNPPSGPVFVALAANALDDLAEMEIIPSGPPLTLPTPNLSLVEEAARILTKAANPVMLVGDRLAQAGGVPAAVALAEQLGAAVYATSVIG